MRWPDDRKRPLTDKGLARTRRSSHGLARLEPGIALVLSSPLERCVQTAACLGEALEPGTPVRFTEALSPGGSWRDVLVELESVHETVDAVLVGHEPDLGKLAGVLLFGAPAALPLGKAGACSIEFETRCAPGRGRLRWFLPPRALRRFARQGSTV
jgi:phosphohistidine phosphatase